MQAIELPTDRQIKHIKSLIQALGEHVRPYALGDLSRTEAIELTGKLEVIALYDQLPPQQQKNVHDFMIKCLERQDDHKQK